MSIHEFPKPAPWATIPGYRDPAEIIDSVSGTYHGVNWTIQSTMLREPGFRVIIDGTLIATMPTQHAARAIRTEYINEIIADGLVETLEAA